MRKDKKYLWEVAAVATGAYAFFALQFAVPTQTSYSMLVGSLARLNLKLDGEVNQPLAVSIALFLPYIAIVLFFQIFFSNIWRRLTIKRRLEDFETAVRDIARYHHERKALRVVQELVDAEMPYLRNHAQFVALTMIDMLITDLRDAFQELLQRSDVKVAVFIRDETASRPELTILSTTEFDFRQEKAIRLPQATGTQFCGFAGAAWNTAMAVSGSSRNFFLVQDQRFYPHLPSDTKRSYFCIPVRDQQKAVNGILSIDSGYWMDFIVSSDFRRTLHSKIEPLEIFLSHYLFGLQYAPGERDSRGP